MSDAKPILYRHIDWRTGFDWKKRKPTGRSMKDRAIIKAQQEGRTWFKLHYLEEYVEVTAYSEALARKTLVLVEEFLGEDLVRSEPMEVSVPVPPQRKVGGGDEPDTI
jgi:hypothetical protein